MANTADKNQRIGAKQLNDVTDLVDFIRNKLEEYEEERRQKLEEYEEERRQKLEEYEEERRQKDKVIKVLQGKVSTLHDHVA